MKRWIAGGSGGSSCSPELQAGRRQDRGEELKIGMVTDVGGLNDRGFNHLAYVGLLQAKKRSSA